MDALITDLRGGWRILTKSPGFAVIAIATLAIGIGGNAVMFSILRGVLLRPLAYPASNQIVQAWTTHPQRGQSVLSPYNIADWAKESRTLESLAGYGFESPALVGRGVPVRVSAVEVMGRFFETFRVAPVMGRALTREDEEKRARVAVLSYSGWRRLFAGDPDIVGKSVSLDSGPVMMVGVMPAGFTFPYAGTDMWTPPSADWMARGRNSGFLFGVGRVRDGVTLPAAQAEADAIAASFRAQYPGPNRDVGFRIVRLQDQIVGSSRSVLIMLMAAVGMVLLIACTNVASLLLTRASGRRREMATRAALGASRWRLVRQVLTESCVLGATGGLLGLLAGYGAFRLLATNFPYAIPRMREVHMDGAVFLFALGLALAAGLLFGLTPAFSFSPGQMVPALKEGGAQSGSGHRALRRVLVGTELALSLALLVSATLVIRSLWLLHNVEPGFATRSVLGMRLSLPEKQYPDFGSRAAVYQHIIDRLRRLPGVASVGGTNDLPFSGSRTGSSFSIIGRPEMDDQANQHADYRTVAGDYFRAMSIPLVRGRLLGDHDTATSSKVMVINRTFAQRYFPTSDALGQHVRVKDETYEIVGVVGDLKHDQLTAAALAEMYLPHAQSHVPGWMSFVVATGGNVNALIPSVRAAVAEVAPEQPLYDVRSMDLRVESSIASERLTAMIIGAFAGTALLLALIGVYGVFAFSVTQRTREIGVRMALGADAARVLGLFLRESAMIAIFAVVAGLVIAASTSRLLSRLLFGVKPLNVTVYAVAAGVLMLVALAGSYLPARRAARVEPTVALRYE